jgi:hypothetical protein
MASSCVVPDDKQVHQPPLLAATGRIALTDLRSGSIIVVVLAKFV